MKKKEKEKILDELYRMYLQKMMEFIYKKYLPPVKITKKYPPKS